MSTASNFNEASQVLGGLSKLSASYPQASAFFSAASIVTGIFGSLFGPSAAEKQAEATAKFRNEVLQGLNHISQQLDDIKSELGTIESELQEISKQLSENNEERLDILFGYIDSDYENLYADSQSKSYALAVFNNSNSTLYALNTLNEILTSSVFNNQPLLQGGLSLPGYMYIKSKMIQGLYLMGYATSIAENGRDFGSDFKLWSQHFADHLKTIIEYGKANPNQTGFNTAHFAATWFGMQQVNGQDKETTTPIYCTDTICFSPAITPTMPQKIHLAAMAEDSGYTSYFTDNKFINIYPDYQTSEFNSAWCLDEGQEVTCSNVRLNNGTYGPIKILINQAGDDLTSALLITEPDWVQPGEFNTGLFLAPETHLLSASGDLYMGSVDGILNTLPYVSQNQYLPLHAFIYDGTTKESLLQAEAGSSSPGSVKLSDINSLSNSAVTINFSSFREDGLPIVSIVFTSTGQYLWLNDEGNWTLVNNYEQTMLIAYDGSIFSQAIQSPYDMKPVPITLVNQQTGKARQVIIHQSPFD